VAPQLSKLENPINEKRFLAPVVELPENEFWLFQISRIGQRSTLRYNTLAAVR
jgi:hypothetical protein